MSMNCVVHAEASRVDALTGPSEKTIWQVSLELQFARDYSSSAGSGETTGPAQSTCPGPANVNWLPSWNESRRPYRDVRKPHFGVCLKTSLPRSPGFVLRKGGKEMPAGDIDFEVITPKILYLVLLWRLSRRRMTTARPT
jgi:hypothetical protein